MTFNDWQIDRLRTGLQLYRTERAENGPLLPWRDVIDSLLLSPATRHTYPRSGEEPAFKEEALRRFAAGHSTLQPEKLEDVKRFLVAANVLDEAEFAEDASLPSSLLAIHAALVPVPSRTRPVVRHLADRYRSHGRRGGEEAVELRVIARPSDALVYVEEQIEAQPLNGPGGAEGGRAELRGSFVRRGCAFGFTADAVLSVFVRSERPDDVVQYLQVKPNGARQEDDGALFLCRVGAGVVASEPPVIDSLETALRAFQVARFVPVDAPDARRPRRGRGYGSRPAGRASSPHQRIRGMV